MLLREGEPADRFYLIRRGAVALEVHAPGRGALVIETLHAGDVVGWSWLFAPYRWQLDAPRDRAVRADRIRRRLPARQVRGRPRARLPADAPVRRELIDRLQATRLQLLDVYGHARAAA